MPRKQRASATTSKQEKLKKKIAAITKPDQIVKEARHLHGNTVPELVYTSAIAPLIGGTMDPHAAPYVRDVIARMAPKDPAEEMLVSQLLFAHARVMRLTELANRQSSLEGITTIHEYADRASNTYRRLMLALSEYRQPPRTGDNFTIVKQANVASQQVVQNHEKTNQTATNEQGFGCTGRSAESGKATPALPVECERIEIPAFLRRQGETVEPIHRPKDAGRQSKVPGKFN